MSKYFYDPLVWKYTPLLIDSFNELRKEFEQYAPSEYESSSTLYNNSAIASSKWHLIPFLTKSIIHHKNIERCQTVKILIDKMPIFDNCIFSILEPKCVIPPHIGHSDAHYRVHLGIKTDGQSWIRVGDQKRYWQEKQALIFHDCDNHEVVNPSEETRVVFLFDILKEDYENNIQC